MNMKNGFIYPVINKFISLLWYLNFVEYVKMSFAWSYAKILRRTLTDDEIISIKNIAIDTFMILKWTAIILIIASGCTSDWVKLIVWYLIVSNLFTYFYYHVWGSGFALRGDIHSQRRRFVNFLLSMGFYLACYAYLYQFHYAADIGWPDNLIDTTNAIYLSIANAFTLTYGGFSPLNQTARIIFASELINTFFFFVIIIVNSVPSNRDQEK